MATHCERRDLFSCMTALLSLAEDSRSEDNAVKAAGDGGRRGRLLKSGGEGACWAAGEGLLRCWLLW